MRELQGINASALDFLPGEKYLVVGDLDGYARCITYADDTKETCSVKIFQRPIRNVKCISTDEIIASSSNGFVSLLKFSKGHEGTENSDDGCTLKIIWRVKVSSDAISCLCYLEDTDRIAIGTDIGDLIVISRDDPKEQLLRIDPHDDYISSISYNGPKKVLLAASGDGCMSVFDARSLKEIARSECLERELLCMILVADGSRVVCGTSSGTVDVFDWGFFGTPAHRIKGLGAEVNCMSYSGTGDAFIIGTSSGLVQLLSNQKKESYCQFDHSVERLCISNDSTVAHVDENGLIKVWNVFEMMNQCYRRPKDVSDGFETQDQERSAIVNDAHVSFFEGFA